MKKIIGAFLSCLLLITLVGCKNNSSYLMTGQKVTLSDDTPVCTSKENVDKMTSYLRQNNTAGVEDMIANGEAVILPKGTEINIVNSGIVTEIEADNGQNYFVPIELIKFNNSKKDKTEPTKETEKENMNIQEIHDYMQDIWPHYESMYSSDEAEAVVFIQTSEKFKKPIIEIYRAWMLVENKKSGLDMSENEIDALGIIRLKQIGFREENGKWYYGNEEVNVGTPLSTPNSMKPKKSLPGKELDVQMDVQTYTSDVGRFVKFYCKTNLPYGMDLMVTLSRPDINFFYEESVEVINGHFETNWIPSLRGQELSPGTYTLEITSPAVSVMKPYAQEVLGERGRNMKGKYVKFDPIVGNTISYKKDIVIK